MCSLVKSAVSYSSFCTMNWNFLRIAHVLYFIIENINPNWRDRVLCARVSTLHYIQILQLYITKDVNDALTLELWPKMGFYQCENLKNIVISTMQSFFSSHLNCYQFKPLSPNK